jgi:phosphoglycerol transferase MdoB-like AlkP superfamily enzyme
MIIMNDWRRAVAYAFLAVVFLGFCLYIAFNYLISAAPPQLIGGYEVTYLLSTILSDMLPRFFWTGICFIVVSMGLGLYMGSHLIMKKRWEIIVYIFAPAFLLAFFQNITFLFLDANARIAGVGTTSLEDTLDNFFVGTCAPILFCFLIASLGVGFYIGARKTKN